MHEPIVRPSCGRSSSVDGRRPVSRRVSRRPRRQPVVKSAWSVPRMPDGHPDLQGVWANNNMTPLERPKQFGLRATMTDAEFAAVKKNLSQQLMDGGDAFFADELILGGGGRQDEVHALATRRPATTRKRGCRSASSTTAPRSSSTRRTAASRRSRRAPSSGRARWPRSGRSCGPADSCAGHGAQHALRPRRHPESARRLSELLRRLRRGRAW